MPRLNVWNIEAAAPDGTKVTAEVRTPHATEQAVKDQYDATHPGFKAVKAERPTAEKA